MLLNRHLLAARRHCRGMSDDALYPDFVSTEADRVRWDGFGMCYRGRLLDEWFYLTRQGLKNPTTIAEVEETMDIGTVTMENWPTLGTYHAESCRDATSLYYDGQPFVDINRLPTNDGRIEYEVQFRDGTWLLAGPENISYNPCRDIRY